MSSAHQRETEMRRLVDGKQGWGSASSPTKYSSIPRAMSFIDREEDIIADRNIPEAKCSVFETTANLLAVCTGSGMLSLPYTARVMGSSAFVLVAIFCGCAMYTFYLLAETIESVYEKKRAQLREGGITVIEEIDYLSLGKEALGRYGDKIVLTSFGLEISLALVSFLINIGINIHIINSNISITQGILIASVISSLLSLLNLKLAAISSALGLSMTLLTLAAILMSGLQLEQSSSTEAAQLQYHTMIPAGVPVSLGLIAFCYGGHGVFPQIYMAMDNRTNYMEVIRNTTLIVLVLYNLVFFMGYYFFAQYTLTPITLNIGEDLNMEDLAQSRTLKIVAALGIVFNLQVTCPLVTFALRDLTLQIIDINPTLTNKHVTSTVLTVCSFLVSCMLSGHFATVCSLVGSLATSTNSITLPIIFYHALYHGPISATRKSFHLGMFIFAISSALCGVMSNVCTLTDAQDSTGHWGELCEYLMPMVPT